MEPSPQIHIELDRCIQLFDKLSQGQSLDEVEECWKEFLSGLERVWNKCESYFGKSPKWNGWKGRYEKLRKSDPVLSYLINARGAHEHTVAEIVRRDHGSISIGAGNNGPVHIKRLVIANGNVDFEGTGNLSIKFNPATLRLLAVINRGREYPAPIKHIDQQLTDIGMVAIALLGLNFYKKAVAEAEFFFL
jgi:hypothetical protein